MSINFAKTCNCLNAYIVVFVEIFVKKIGWLKPSYPSEQSRNFELFILDFQRSNTTI